jgi:hypothetical protein
MSNWNVGQNWEYSRWVKNYARNSRITEPTNVQPYVGELTAIKTFLKLIWNPVTQTGTRPWLQATFQRKATAAGSGDNYECDIDNEPTYVLIEMLEVVGRDLKKIPITLAEKNAANILLAVAPARVFGTKYTYGNVGGAIVTIP